MSRRKLVWSLLSATLLAASAGAGSAALSPPPAGAADNNYVFIKVADDGFSPSDVSVKVGDPIVFTLADGASDHHTITSDDNGSCPAKPGAPCWPEMAFDDGHPCTYRNYQLPRVRCITFVAAGTFPYYDRYAREAGGPDLHGTIVVAASSSAPPPTTTTTVRPTTSTTARPATTTTLAPTTTTTAGGAIHPLMISDPPPTTTTAPPASPAGQAAGSVKTGAGATTTTTTAKVKAKAAPAAPTTTAPAPPPPAPDNAIFDPATLTPAPAPAPPAAAAVTGLGDSGPLDAALAGILHPDQPADDGRPLMLVAIGVLGIFLLAAGVWGWHHRSSRYFPA